MLFVQSEVPGADDCDDVALILLCCLCSLKYREQMIVMSDSLRTIDGNPVLENQRRSLLKLQVGYPSLFLLLLSLCTHPL